MAYRSAPARIETEQELYASALRALMRRAHSVHEMKKHLERRAPTKETVLRVIARLRENGYVDDARYAFDFARRHANSRRQGRFRIARELRTRGISQTHIDAALDAVFAETGEEELIRARLKRRLSSVRGPLSRQKIAGIYRSLLRAGFSAEKIRAELRGVTRGDLPDLSNLASSDEEMQSAIEGDDSDGTQRSF